MQWTVFACTLMWLMSELAAWFVHVLLLLLLVCLYVCLPILLRVSLKCTLLLCLNVCLRFTAAVSACLALVTAEYACSVCGVL